MMSGVNIDLLTERFCEIQCTTVITAPVCMQCCRICGVVVLSWFNVFYFHNLELSALI